MGGGASKGCEHVETKETSEVGTTEGSVAVKDVISGSEAEICGVHAGDIVTWVNDVLTTSMLYNDVCHMIDQSERPLNIAFARILNSNNRHHLECSFTQRTIGLSFKLSNKVGNISSPEPSWVHKNRDDCVGELGEVDILAEEIRVAQRTRQQSEEEESMQIALALSMSQSAPMPTSPQQHRESRPLQRSSSSALESKWQEEVDYATKILTAIENGSSAAASVSFQCVRFCEQVISLQSMFELQVHAEELTKFQASLEEARDAMETELARDIFAKSIMAAKNRIKVMWDMEESNLQDLKLLQLEDLIADEAEVTVLLQMQTDLCNGLIENGIQERARNEAFVYFSSLLNMDVSSIVDGDIAFAEYVDHFKEHGFDLTSIIKPYWLAHLANSLIGQICLDLDRQSLAKLIRAVSNDNEIASSEADLSAAISEITKELSVPSPPPLPPPGPVPVTKERMLRERSNRIHASMARMKTRVNWTPLELVTNKAQGKKMKTLPGGRPPPPLPPSSSTPTSDKSDNGGVDFEFI